MEIGPDIELRAWSVEPWAEMPKDEMVPWAMKRHEHKKAGHSQGAIKINNEELDDFKREDPFGFVAWSRAEFLRFMPEIKDIQYWTGYYDSSCKPGASGGWCQGFPHEHGWQTGYTMVLMVQAPERGGSLWIVEDDGTEVEAKCIEGQAYVLAGTVKHGPKLMQGDTPRLTMIATAFAP